MSQDQKKIKDLNQPEILKDTRIIIFFSYLVILSIACYISYKLYQNKRKPLSISSQTFALIETKSSLPENTFLDLGNTSYDKIKQEVDQINSLKYCNPGQCVLDIKAGTKRCPSTKNDSLIFNPSLELCTDPYSCPDSQPFAVQSTGETKLKYCEPETRCRCIKDKYCAPYVAQILETTNGNPWIQNNGYKNYAITALSSGTTEGFNLDPLVITPDNESTQYCKINPEYTQRMENGCKFDVNSGEPMDCDSGSYLKLDQESKNIFNVYTNNTNWKGSTPFVDGWVYTTSSDIYVPKSSDTTLQLYIPSTAWTPDQESNQYKQTWLGQNGDFIPRSGYFQDQQGKYFFSYNGVINYKNIKFTVNELSIPKLPDGSDGPEKVTTYGNYTNNITILQNVSTSGKPGLPPSLKAGDKLVLNTVIFSNCIKTNLPSDNYKNMLNCVQTQNQPCVDGQMAYNVDRGDPRQFAQYNVGNTPIGTPERDLTNYLFDPSYYTVSCVKGGGCSKLIDQTLCEDENCIPAFDEKKSRFHTEMDDSAIATQWLLEHKNYQNGFSENYIYNADTKQITFDTKNSLLTLENGDYWSIKTVQQDSFVTAEYPKNTISFVFNSTDGITQGMEVIYPGMCSGPDGTNIVKVSKIYENNKVELNAQSYEGICSGTQFRFFNVLNSNQYGLITKCTKDTRGIQKCYLTDLYGSNSNIEIGTSPFINVYKQFGFNGINYNTNINFNSVDSQNFVGFRKYNQNSFINLGNIKDKPGAFYNFFKDITPPLSAINLFQENKGTQSYTQTFSDPYALYKRFNSLYYPIWNNNSFKQECIIPKPFLVAFPVMDNLSGSNDSIGRILIQFSGKHFDHYAYYNDSFCYNLFTPLKKASKITDYVSSNQVLVLDQVNKNIKVNDLISSSDCSFDVYFTPDTNLNGSNTPPTGVSFQISIASNNMVTGNFTQLDDKYMPLVYNNKTYNDSNSYIIGNGNTYNFYNSDNNKNYFLGKVYSGKISGITYYFNLKTSSKVVNIDQNLIETNTNSLNILPNDVLIQFLDPNETLEIGFVDNFGETSPGFGCSFGVCSITQGRINSIQINNYGQEYLEENRPLVAVTKYKLKNN